MTLKKISKNFQTGDIIGQSFSDSDGPFGLASRVFEKATGGKISHVGLINIKKSPFGTKVYVIEATDPFVKETELKEFIENSGNKFAVYRYKNRLTKKQKKN